jgi:hypothetical protein
MRVANQHRAPSAYFAGRYSRMTTSGQVTLKMLLNGCSFQNLPKNLWQVTTLELNLI